MAAKLGPPPSSTGWFSYFRNGIGSNLSSLKFGPTEENRILNMSVKEPLTYVSNIVECVFGVFRARWVGPTEGEPKITYAKQAGKIWGSHTVIIKEFTKFENGQWFKIIRKTIIGTFWNSQSPDVVIPLTKEPKKK